jgi:hypothetical protein
MAKMKIFMFEQVGVSKFESLAKFYPVPRVRQ